MPDLVIEFVEEANVEAFTASDSGYDLEIEIGETIVSSTVVDEIELLEITLPPAGAGGGGGGGDAAAEVEAHRLDTTNVHGIPNTADLVVTTDSRMSNARPPTAHTHSPSDVTGFTEAVQDALATFFNIVGGTVSYDDANNQVIITIPPDTNTTDPEVIRDTIGAAIVPVGLISVTVNDGADTISIGTTATANDTDANLKNRANHTGSQASSTITGLDAQLAGGFAVVTASGGGAQTLAPAAAHKFTMTSNTTFTFTANSTTGHTFALHLSGAFTPTFPSSVRWADGAAPTYGSPSVYVFTTFDGGTNWMGSQAGKAFA